jgi:triosephosphate isomerase
MNTPVITLGVSLKMYFGYRRTLDWCQAIAAQLAAHEGVRSGAIEVFVIPSHPTLAPVLDIFDGLARVGAQNLFWEDEGAYTGEVSPRMLREMGCSVAEIGHAERRRYFAETDQQIADKTVGAWRNGLTPVLCLGEATRGSADAAVRACLQQLDASLASARRDGLNGELILAYEPQWAIGAATPASAHYIGQVCQALRLATADQGVRIIYGGSAGPGLLSQLDGQVDGLFLGRFAHDPAAFASILDEAGRLCASGTANKQGYAQWQSA